MKLLWRGAWIEVPGYAPSADGVVVGVEAMASILRIDNASERPATAQPGRKVAIFLMTDGPVRTFRKARTKRDEPKFTGDLHVAVVAGRRLDTDVPVVALAIRVPPSSQQVPVHALLVHQLSEPMSDARLGAVAARLAAGAASLGPMTRQSYLYSGMEPPDALVAMWHEALSGDRGVPGGVAVKTTRPPVHRFERADTVLRCAEPVATDGTPALVLGAGDYVRTEVLPALRSAGMRSYCITDREPQIAAAVARTYGFELAATDAERAIEEMPGPGLVIVATAHDSHARLACLAAERGHRVFVEKPPAVTRADATRLGRIMGERPGAIEVGFNRRYHPLARKARAHLATESGPTSITCVVKELTFQPDHWYFWANQGTRITGNLCHWIDLAIFWLEGRPEPVSITLSPRVAGAESDDEERVLTVVFDDGSLLTVLGTTRGDDVRGVQEQIELRRGCTTVMIDDLWKMRVRRKGVERYTRTLFRDKAHTQMYTESMSRMANGEPAVYTQRELLMVSAIQIAASDLARSDGRECEVPRLWDLDPA